MSDDDIFLIATAYIEQDNKSPVSFYPSNLLKFARAIEKAATDKDAAIAALDQWMCNRSFDPKSYLGDIVDVVLSASNGQPK